MNEFYRILRAIRIETGLNQKEFAAKIEMKPVAYNMIESGKNQPSFALLNNLVKVFNVDPSRLFGNGSKDTFKKVVQPENETSFINLVHDYNQKISLLYDRLINIRILLFQELNLGGELTTTLEVELLNSLTKPSIIAGVNNNEVKWPYENLSQDEKVEHLKKLTDCISFFSNTFFQCFDQLYNGIRIPATKEMIGKFLEERAKLTDHWKYTHYINSFS